VISPIITSDTGKTREQRRYDGVTSASLLAGTSRDATAPPGDGRAGLGAALRHKEDQLGEWELWRRRPGVRRCRKTTAMTATATNTPMPMDEARIQD
jgi:hypothetical protein